MTFSDRQLRCRECGEPFVWTAGEQEFYHQKGLLHEPQRCHTCRARAKQERAAARAANMHDIVCSSCGQPGQVPFAPRTDRPVYCSNCFEERRRPAPSTTTPTTAAPTASPTSSTSS